MRRDASAGLVVAAAIVAPPAAARIREVPSRARAQSARQRPQGSETRDLTDASLCLDGHALPMQVQRFTHLFQSFERSAFRLETRDVYVVEAERTAFAAYLAGEPAPPSSPETLAWLKLVTNATASDRIVQRVRIVGRPLNSYTRFEFNAYRDNAAAGERIRLLEREWLARSDRWAQEDFWIFDERTVVLLHYDGNGRFLRPEESDRPARYLKAMRRAVDRSVKFDSHPSTMIL